LACSHEILIFKGFIELMHNILSGYYPNDPIMIDMSTPKKFMANNEVSD